MILFGSSCTRKDELGTYVREIIEAYPQIQIGIITIHGNCQNARLFEEEDVPFIFVTHRYNHTKRYVESVGLSETSYHIYETQNTSMVDYFMSNPVKFEIKDEDVKKIELSSCF